MILESNILYRWWWTGKRVANTYSGEEFYHRIIVVFFIVQPSDRLPGQRHTSHSIDVHEQMQGAWRKLKKLIAFIFQRVRSLRHICLCTSVNCVVQSLVQCRMSLAAHFSRSMWPTTRLTHKDASSPLPLGLMQFLGWVESGWEILSLNFFSYIRLTWRLATKWIKRKCAMDIPHLVTFILVTNRIHHTMNSPNWTYLAQVFLSSRTFGRNGLNVMMPVVRNRLLTSRMLKTKTFCKDLNSNFPFS